MGMRNGKRWRERPADGHLPLARLGIRGVGGGGSGTAREGRGGGGGERVAGGVQ